MSTKSGEGASGAFNDPIPSLLGFWCCLGPHFFPIGLQAAVINPIPSYWASGAVIDPIPSYWASGCCYRPHSFLLGFWLLFMTPFLPIGLMVLLSTPFLPIGLLAAVHDPIPSYWASGCCS